MNDTDFPEYGRQCELITHGVAIIVAQSSPGLQEALSCSSAVEQR